jgi:uncharacterized protein YdeI (YjbR/CyaY-like superfamily)
MILKHLNPKVDQYIADGCGRCNYYATAKCKVRNWQVELETLRQIVLESGLNEDLKWAVPCYTFNNANVLVVSAFKDYCSISFFKGALIKDTFGFLDKTSESMQSARFVKFNNTKQIVEKEAAIKGYIFEAIEIEKAGFKVEFAKNLEPIPEELLAKFEEYPELESAFNALTAGRQRGYILHFSQPKQSATRLARIENCMEKILKSEGLNDGYKSK